MLLCSSPFLLLAVVFAVFVVLAAAEGASESEVADANNATELQTRTNISDYDTSTCKRQLGSPCENSSECADLNGHTLSCATEPGSTKKRCTCDNDPSGHSCSYAPGNTTQALYRNCSDALPCVDGHGFYASVEGDCAEKIYCLASTTVGDKYRQCLTCESCLQQSSDRFNCHSICPPKRIEANLKAIEANKTQEEEIAKEKEKDEAKAGGEGGEDGDGGENGAEESSKKEGGGEEDDGEKNGAEAREIKMAMCGIMVAMGMMAVHL